MLVGFTTSYARQGSQGETTIRAVEELKATINGQGSQLTSIYSSINELKVANATAARDLGYQADRLRGLETRLQIVESRLQQQGERLAKKGI